MVYNDDMTSKDLKTWRKKNGYTQIKLANILGVTNQTIFRWESGERSIPSFLHLTLECVEKKGDESRRKGIKKKREVKK
jgi:transcriptional regulator with XRE-family HTH domain